MSIFAARKRGSKFLSKRERAAQEAAAAAAAAQEGETDGAESLLPEVPEEAYATNAEPLPAEPEEQPVIADDPAPKRGRPRTDATIQRDAAVLELLKRSGEHGLTKVEIASDLNANETDIYTSLRRLNDTGQVRKAFVKERRYVWYAV